MKVSIRAILMLMLLSSSASLAQAASSSGQSLEDQLQTLNLPANQAPVAVSTEKLYSVQSRFNPLKGRFELGIGAAQDFTNSSFLSSRQMGGSLRYHLNDRFSLGFVGAQVFNSLTETTKQLMDSEGFLPDVAYAKYRANLELAINTFYGKFRISNNTVLYLDQYIALGAGVVGLNRGNATMGTVDLGFAFWLGRQTVVRLGMKDHIYREARQLSTAMTQHWLGHVAIGWMPGGSPRTVQ
ncbi:outer membrane beta-barrel domain-containing protein [bacterium]|nr:outer membrane beta-barrel domain-containing protein [bacterium]